MNQSKIETIKAVFTHKYWIAFTLAGVFFCFFGLSRGGDNVFIEITFYFLALNVLTGRYRLKAIPAAYWVTVGICAYLLVVSVVFATHESHYRWMKNIPRMLVIVFGIHYLYQKKIDDWVILFFGITLSASVCWQFVLFHVYDMVSGNFFNTHMLGAFSAFALPALCYFFWMTTGWYRYLMLIIGILALDLLLQVGSRPAFLGLLFGSIFVLAILVRGRFKWIGMSLIFFSLAILYITDFNNLASRLKQLIVLLPKEERVRAWSMAWNKMLENSLLDWIFGNGIGYFKGDYSLRAADSARWVSPHNILLDLIYCSGISGFILVSVALIILICFVMKTSRKSQNIKIRFISGCLIVIFITWSFICGLNFSLYSKHTIYPLAFILGPMLVVIQKK